MSKIIDVQDEEFSIMRQRAWGLYLESDREYVTRILNKVNELFGIKTVRTTDFDGIYPWLEKVHEFMESDDYKRLDDIGKLCFKNHVLSISREIIRRSLF